MRWPKHEASLSLTHNDHKDYYQTVERFIEAENIEDVQWVSPEQKQKAIETNDFWCLLWCPDSPVGSCILYAADLDVLLAAAVKGDEE